MLFNKVVAGLARRIYYIYLDPILFEKILQILKNITLRKPRTPFVLYFFDIYETYNQNLFFQNLYNKIHENWNNLQEMRRKKYEEKFEQEKLKFNNESVLTQYYLFHGHDEINKIPPSPNHFFENEKRLEIFMADKFLPENILKANIIKDSLNVTEEQTTEYECIWLRNLELLVTAKKLIGNVLIIYSELIIF